MEINTRTGTFIRHLRVVVHVFYRLGGVDVFHHDIHLFSVGGHLCVNAMDVQWCVSLFNQSTHLISGLILGLVYITFILDGHFVIYVGLLRYVTCLYRCSRFCIISSDGIVSNPLFPGLFLTLSSSWNISLSGCCCPKSLQN